MILSTLSVLHIILGTIGLLAGTIAISAKKGATLHQTAGKLFFVTMLLVSLAGAYLGYIKSDIPFSTALFTSLLGLYTSYLVVTSWITVKRKPGQSGKIEIFALIYVLCLGLFSMTVGVEAAVNDMKLKEIDIAMPVGTFYFYGALSLLLAIGDIKVICFGGIYRAQRIARHLWRMCMAFLISANTLFIGNPQVFPEFIQQAKIIVIPVLTMPVLIIFILMLYWTVNILFVSRKKKAKSEHSHA